MLQNVGRLESILMHFGILFQKFVTHRFKFSTHVLQNGRVNANEMVWVDSVWIFFFSVFGLFVCRSIAGSVWWGKSEQLSRALAFDPRRLCGSLDIHVTILFLVINFVVGYLNCLNKWSAHKELTWSIPKQNIFNRPSVRLSCQGNYRIWMRLPLIRLNKIKLCRTVLQQRY